MNPPRYATTFAITRGQSGNAYITVTIDGEDIIVPHNELIPAADALITEWYDIGEGMGQLKEIVREEYQKVEYETIRKAARLLEEASKLLTKQLTGDEK